MGKKICYILSNIDKALAFEWIAEGLHTSYQLSFVLMGNKGTHLAAYLRQKSIPYIEIPYSGKRDMVAAFFKVCRHLYQLKPDVVHTHMFEANLIGLTAAWLTRVKERIYTRHHSDYHFVYAPSGIKYDKWCNRIATKIVAISQNVATLLIESEKVPAAKIKLIHHGFDLQSFEHPDPKKVAALQQKYNPHGQQPVIGVIARQTELKGIQHIIPAFALLLKDFPNALLMLANAHGVYKPKIDLLLTALVPPQNQCEIRFENEIAALYPLFTVYVHAPITPTAEAFGQTYVEALAAGIPSVFTLSGVAAEFIEPEKNALIVPFANPQSIYTALKRLLTQPKLCAELGKQGRIDVQKFFTLGEMLTKLRQLYG